MPEAGLDWMDSAALLSTEELQRLLRIATTHLGIREIRFTGGEPLLRRDLSEIIAYAAQLRPRPTLSLTTNGVGLDRKARSLAQAGLDRIKRLPPTPLTGPSTQRSPAATGSPTCWQDLGPPATPHGPIKINAVLQRGLNDGHAAALLDFLPHPRIRLALHRTDATGRRPYLGQSIDDHRGRDSEQPERALHPDSGHLTSRLGTSRTVVHRRRTPHRRHHSPRSPARSAPTAIGYA